YFTQSGSRAALGTHYGLFRPHVLSGARMRSLIEHFERQQLEWDCSERPEWQSLRARLLKKNSGGATRPESPKPYLWARLFAIQSGFRVLHDLRASVPRRAIYLNVAQHAFEHHRFFRWLGHRADVTAVFLIHDLLPLDFPEFFPRGYEARF